MRRRTATVKKDSGLAKPLVDAINYLIQNGRYQQTGALVPSLDRLLANSKLRAVFHGRAAHAALAPQDGRNALLGAASATLALHGLTRVAGHETRVAVGRISGIRREPSAQRAG